jgi:hypothetical protein
MSCVLTISVPASTAHRVPLAPTISLDREARWSSHQRGPSASPIPHFPCFVPRDPPAPWSVLLQRSLWPLLAHVSLSIYQRNLPPWEPLDINPAPSLHNLCRAAIHAASGASCALPRANGCANLCAGPCGACPQHRQRRAPARPPTRPCITAWSRPVNPRPLPGQRRERLAARLCMRARAPAPAARGCLLHPIACHSPGDPGLRALPPSLCPSARAPTALRAVSCSAGFGAVARGRGARQRQRLQSTQPP